MSIISEQYEAQSYVPRVFKQLNVQPTCCKLVAKILEGNKAEYTYHLHWEGDAIPDGIGATLGALSSSVTSSRTSLHPCNKKEDNEFLDVEKIMVKAEKELASEGRPRPSTQPKMVLCDGPCGKEYAPADLKLFGRCEHHLCNLCSGVITNLDGSQGCSAFNCAYFGVYDFLPEPMAKQAYDNQIRQKVMDREKLRREVARPVTPRKKPSRYSLSSLDGVSSSRDGARCVGSTLTFNGLAPSPRVKSEHNLFTDMSLLSVSKATAAGENEVVHVRLMILERLPGNADKKIYKRVLQDEVAANTLVKEAIGIVLGDSINTLFSPNASPLRLYFYAGLKGNQIRKMTSDEFEKKTLSDFTHNHGSVHFVLDSADAVKKIEKDRHAQ